MVPDGPPDRIVKSWRTTAARGGGNAGATISEVSVVRSITRPGDWHGRRIALRMRTPAEPALLSSFKAPMGRSSRLPRVDRPPGAFDRWQVWRNLGQGLSPAIPRRADRPAILARASREKALLEGAIVPALALLEPADTEWGLR